MPLDPHLAGLLDLLAASGQPPMHESTPEDARRGFRTLTVDLRDPAALPEVASVEDVRVPGAEGLVPARIYRPATEGPLPTIVMFHGGGFVIGDLDTHDLTARTLATGCDAVVVSVDYRLAPEHPGRPASTTRSPRPGGRRPRSPRSVATSASQLPATAPAATCQPSSPRRCATRASRSPASC